MNTEPAKQASDKSALLTELLDSNIPKTEREHVAAAEIERLKIEIGTLNGTHKFMQDSLKELQNEINRLNQMLRETGYGQGQIDAYAAQCEEIDRLHEKIKIQNKDWCDDDEAIKQQALRVLPKEKVEGDSVHVPRMGELAEMMADEIMRLRTTIHKYKTGGLRR